MNFEQTEAGTNALGVALRDGAGEVIAGLSVSVPPVRFRQAYDAGLVQSVFEAKKNIESDLANFVAGQ